MASAHRIGPTRTERTCDDTGGVWIVTGWVLGLIVYAGVVLAWHAGFTAAAPFVVIPALLVVMIGVGNLVNGARPGRPAPRFNRPDLDPIPIATLRTDNPAAPDNGTEGTPTGGTDGAPSGA